MRCSLGIWNGQFYDDDVHSGACRASAEGDRNFNADVWSFKGRQTITGSWSKGEDDVIQIRFKMSFSSVLWAPMFFNGRFDPERDALTGDWGLSADLESFVGKMEFRRVGTYRRVRFEGLMAYKRRADADRRAALAELAAYDQELGI